jgi:hypothetical protein
MLDGHAVVELDLGSHGGFVVLVNRHVTHSHDLKLSGGGSLALTQGHGRLAKVVTATVRWRDGTSVAVETTTAIKLWMEVNVSLAQDRLGHVAGLLGNAGVGANEEFAGREGKHYSANVIGEGWIYAPYAKILYGEWGQSWRISQHESLFSYARHKSTSSYTIKGFPFASFSLGTAGASVLQHASTACTGAGITDPALLQDCEYDVAATGQQEYANGDAIMQEVTGPGPPPPPQQEPGAGGTQPPGSTPTGGPQPPPAPVPVPNPGIDLGAGDATPTIAYDPGSGETYVAWLDPSSEDTVDVCAVPSGAGACNGGAGPYRLTDPLASGGGASPVYFSAQVLVQPGGAVVVVANVEGASKAVLPSGYSFTDGVIAWSSAAGGAGFVAPGGGLANGGKLLANSHGAGEMPAGGALALDATHILTYDDMYPFGSGATDFTLSAPAPAATPVVDKGEAFGESLEANGTRVAAMPAPGAPGKYLIVVVGAASGKCSGADATGYSDAIGTPAALQTQVWPTFKQIACQAHAPVLTGGSAIGLLDTEGAGLAGEGSDGVYWRPFDTTSDTFSAPVPISDETAVTLDGPTGLSASSDAGGGVYAAWYDNRGIVVDYSNSNGTSWQAPVLTGIESANGVLAGVGGGGAEVAYEYAHQEYLDPSA